MPGDGQTASAFTTLLVTALPQTAPILGTVRELIVPSDFQNAQPPRAINYPGHTKDRAPDSAQGYERPWLSAFASVVGQRLT
jgi:hypothetical protein